MRADGTNVRDITNNPQANDFQPAWSPAGIIFSSSRAAPDQLYVVRPDGSGLRRLTTGPTQNLDPSWSRDGTRFVFSSSRNARSEIGTLTSAGYRPLTPGPWLDGDPAFARDRHHLAFFRSRSFGHQDIYVADANGRGTFAATTRQW